LDRERRLWENDSSFLEMENGRRTDDAVPDRLSATEVFSSAPGVGVPISHPATHLSSLVVVLKKVAALFFLT